ETAVPSATDACHPDGVCRRGVDTQVVLAGDLVDDLVATVDGHGVGWAVAVVDRPEEHEVRPTGGAGHRRPPGLPGGEAGGGAGGVQPVGGVDELGTGALEEVEAAVEGVDGDGGPTLEVAFDEGWGEDHQPQRNEDQDQHERHSPSTYLPWSKDPSYGPFASGGWSGWLNADTVRRRPL